MVASPKPEPLKIFISHSAADLEAARGVYRALREAGFRVWMREEDLHEEDVELGSTWRKVAREAAGNALQASNLVLFLLSKKSRDDRGQARELSSALSADKRVVPAFLEADALDNPPLHLAPYSGLLKKLRGQLIDSAEGLAKLIRGLHRLNRDKTGSPLQELSPVNEPVRGRLRVRRLVLENVRCFESMNLAVDDGTGWITVLGDNAAGKSTVLRSLALGLCQESDAAGLMRELPGSMVREGASSGTIRIELHDDEDDRDLSIVTSLRRDESTGEEILRKETDPAPFPWNRLFVCGYGTNRGRQAHAGFETYTVRDAVRTLFDDAASLQNPELVLLRQSPDLRQEIEHKVLQILMLDAPGYEVTYPKTGPVIEGPWGRQALRVLSDGYRSTMQWVLDFIGWGVYAGRFNGGRELGGILLVDELEQHLHPVWQRHIVDRLRRQFPATQIFATTHTPLLAAASADFENTLVCRLKAHLDGSPELVIIERQELAGLRADQVLTSEAFGLVTSRSLRSEGDLDRFAELRGKTDRTAEEEAELARLSEQLDQSLRFGERPFEQEVEAAVDKTLREMNTSADPELLDLETRRQLRELFRSEPDA
ncbi:MAG: TIR domain-containing protein [Acidobacteria bacterium]|nr:TIR domain-containing protein [Acidobacteriota bacterium]